MAPRLTEEVDEHMADEPQDPQGTQGAPPAAGDATPAPNTPSPPQGAQGAASPPAGDPVDQTSDVQALRHEAASRRRELRTVEKERDALRERVDARDRAEVAAIASNSLADPSDFTGAVDLDDLRGEDGAVDFAAVEKSIGELLRAKPHYAIQTPRVNLHQGARQAEPERKSFGQALKRDGGR